MKLFQILENFNLHLLIIIIFIISALFSFLIFLIIEKIFYFRKVYFNEKKIYEDLKKAINKKDTILFFNICKKIISPLTNLINAGINQRNYLESQIKESITEAITLELPRLEKNLIIISVLTSFLPVANLVLIFIKNINLFIMLGSKSTNNLGIFSIFDIKILFIFLYCILNTILISLLFFFITKKKNNLILIIEIWADQLVFSIIKNEWRISNEKSR